MSCIRLLPCVVSDELCITDNFSHPEPLISPSPVGSSLVATADTDLAANFHMKSCWAMSSGPHATMTDTPRSPTRSADSAANFADSSSCLAVCL